MTVIQTGYWESQDRLFDGSYQTLADPDYYAFILVQPRGRPCRSPTPTAAR